MAVHTGSSPEGWQSPLGSWEGASGGVVRRLRNLSPPLCHSCHGRGIRLAAAMEEHPQPWPRGTMSGWHVPVSEALATDILMM